MTKHKIKPLELLGSEIVPDLDYGFPYQKELFPATSENITKLFDKLNEIIDYINAQQT